jgi:mediator of RNA polymerase II transcription subunit 5
MADMGIQKKDGFLAEYFKQDNQQQVLVNLSDARQRHLGEWISALYMAEGLSDELFTKCSPHDFYILVPTLMRQYTAAYQQSKLSADSLKAGLECEM